MSSPAQGEPTVPKKESRGTKMLTRMKTIMKKAEKRMSMSGRSTGGPSTTSAVVTSEPAPAEAPQKAEDKHPGATRVPRMQLHEERARKLGERFGLEIKPTDWHSTEGEALRIERPIKMRIHRTCHKCLTKFGTSKECPNQECKHTRCKACPRYPPKRTEEEKKASREKRAALAKERAENPPLVADWAADGKPVTLTRPGKKGGQDLVYRKTRQRVRRHCCKCEKLFTHKNKECEGCKHARCTDCPREPAKSKKFPYGYPGDELGEKNKHFQCSDCGTRFPRESPEGTPCATCNHPLGPDCPRLKPQKVEPEPDADILRSIEERMAKLKAVG